MHDSKTLSRMRKERAGCRRLAYVRGALVGVYDTTDADLDASGGRWATVCEDHTTLCYHDRLSSAVEDMYHREWCDDCEDLT